MPSNMIAGSLVGGRAYFLLGYFDEALRLPNIQSVVYVGKDLFQEDVASKRPSYYFQTAESYVASGLFDAAKSNATETLTILSSDSLMMVYDWEALIEELRDNWASQVAGKPFG
jgi:hypothetical protein